jgi:hypothetical protein
MVDEKEHAEFLALAERRKIRAAEMKREQEAESAKQIERVNPVPTVTHELMTCVKCGNKFEGAVFTAANLPPVRKRFCDPCIAQFDQERAATLSACSLRPGSPDGWAAICEPEFRTVDEGGATVLARLQRECPKLAQVTGWKYGPKGLLLRGSTGRCKTRAVWRLLRGQFDAGKSIVALSSGRFAREYADAAGNHTQSAWFDRLAGADIFFLDDLGKKPWTENAWGEFFELVDERAKNHRPFIITTNEDSKTMQAKCKDPVTWGPLNRRLTESCTPITF